MSIEKKHVCFFFICISPFKHKALHISICSDILAYLFTDSLQPGTKEVDPHV